MRRYVINAFALVGVLALLVSTVALARRPSAFMIHGRAVTYDRRPIVGAAVFLDRGANTSLDNLRIPTYYTFELAPLQPMPWRSYRQHGWKGPIPRECPQGADSVGWRYPASAGKDYGAYTLVEPEWSKYPGPPALPPAR